MMRWRLKLRGVREFVGGMLMALITEPVQTVKFLFRLPLIYLHAKVEEAGQETLSPEMQAHVEETWRNEYREFQRQIDQLPAHLKDFPSYFGKTKYSPKEVREILSTEVAKEIIALCPHVEKLMPYDIFPAHFWQLIHGIPMYFDRMLENDVLHDDVRITLGRSIKCVAVSGVSPEMTAERMCQYLGWELGKGGFDIPRVDEMWRWLFDLLCARPYVFDGYEALLDGEHLVIVRSAHIPQSNQFRDSPEEFERLRKLRWETARAG